MFLRTRNNTAELYEELAAQIIETTRGNPEVTRIAKKIACVMDNLRYQINKLFRRTAIEYREKYGSVKYTSINIFDNICLYIYHMIVHLSCNRDGLVRNNLQRFIDEAVWKKILHLPLLAVNVFELNNCEEIQHGLKQFVVEVVGKWVVALGEGKEEKTAIKNYDELTVDLKIPTNHNIVARFPVRELLLCKK